jgi:serine/threonine protein phosphatase PrpC
VVDLDTMAPLIGKLLDAPPPALAAAAAYRPASFLADAVTIGDFHVAAASHIGMSHAAQGGPRQDSYNFVLTSTGRLVAAIADGMGSRSASQIGSDQFCANVVLAAATNPDATAAEYLRLASARTAEVVRAIYRMEPDAISFVAAVAVIDGTSCEVARVGDVSAFTIDTSGAFTEMYPVDDEHVNVVGAALPDPEAEPELVAVAAPRRLVLVTDGLAGDLRRSVAVRGWLGRVWAGHPTAHAMSDGLRYRRRGSHDDRTAIVVAVPPAPRPAFAHPGEDSVPIHGQAATDRQGTGSTSTDQLAP